MKIALAALFAVFVSISVNQAVAQQARYITDEHYVPLRSGKGNQFRIVHRGLPSGTKLLLLEEDSEWSRVKNAAGAEGWIRNQYLQQEPTAATKLAQAEEKTGTLQNLNRELEAQVNQARMRGEELEAALSTAKVRERQLEDELIKIKQISADAVDLHQRHQALLKQMELLRTELEVLKAENARLGDKSLHTWFLYGAAAVGFGVLIAVVVPALRPRKRPSEWA